MQPLTAAEWERLQCYETLEGADSILDFVARVSPKFSKPEHLRPVAEVLIRAQREPVRACLSVPRRHGKTEIALHGLAWMFLRWPAKKAAYISYLSEFSEEKSGRLRDLAQRAGLVLRSDSRKKSAWETPDGGGLFATGIGGPLTGRGVDLLIVDDPHKNREDADSPTMRDKVHEWFMSTGISSLEPRGSALVIHTRWHEDDLIGRLTSDPDSPWEYINLPAISDDGEALWPERWPRALLDLKRRDVGEYEWSSLFMGQPRPRGKEVFRAPSRYEKAAVWGSTIMIACDPAATAKTTADRSAIVVGAMSITEEGLPSMDVLDVRTLQVETPVLVRELLELQRAWHSPIAVEAVGGFKAVPQMLRDINRSLEVIEVPAAADKFVRAQPVAAAWNDGRVRVPVKAPWVDSLVAETRRFTGSGDSRDDQVDALAHCWNELLKQIRHRRTPDEALSRLAQL